MRRKEEILEDFDAGKPDARLLLEVLCDIRDALDIISELVNLVVGENEHRAHYIRTSQTESDL